jgi:DNA-directed RNA polymerase subunit alpha
MTSFETYILPPTPPEGEMPTLNPLVKVLETDEVSYGRFALEPLTKGYGITLGNPLRRVLLSGIPGCAITWVKIEDIVHEYDSIPGVKEEVMQLLLNIKRIRIKSETGRTGKMRLEIQGEGSVCAGDISTSSDFQIVNPELHLATLNTADTKISVEFNVESGTGYHQAQQHEEGSGMAVGVLPVDAIFNPIVKVNYSVERTRVGQITDYERLVLDIWTDGSITPMDALKEASEELVNHFFMFKTINREGDEALANPATSVAPEIFQTLIERLDLSPRTLNCLKRANISKVGEVLEMSDADLLKIRNFGEKSLHELRDKLTELGVGANDLEQVETEQTTAVVEEVQE